MAILIKTNLIEKVFLMRMVSTTNQVYKPNPVLGVYALDEEEEKCDDDSCKKAVCRDIIA